MLFDHRPGRQAAHPPVHPPSWVISRRGLPAGRGERLQRFAARGDAELPEQALHVRADRVLGDVEASRDLVGAEMLVEEEQDLHLAGAELLGDRVRDARVEPAVRAFEPDLVLVSAGFDAHVDDPLADMRVTADGFRELARRSVALGPRCAAVLEGGYDVRTLPGLVGASLEVFDT